MQRNYQERGHEYRGICHRNDITARASDDLTSAAELMRTKHVEYLVVVGPEMGDSTVRPIGVLSDRDIVIAGRCNDPAAGDGIRELCTQDRVAGDAPNRCAPYAGGRTPRAARRTGVS